MDVNKILLLASIGSSLPIIAPAAKEKNTCCNKPNVIVILADDLGYGDVSANGAINVSTPSIDLLANGGTCLTNGHATSATSTPSRYGLFTGCYPWKNDKAKILPGDAPLIIGVDSPTMPKMFQSAGYKTAAIGKWHLGLGNGKVDWNKTITPNPTQVGFDYSCIIAATVDRVPTVYLENGSVMNLEADDPIEVNYNQNFPGEPTALTNPEMLKIKWSHGHQGTIINGIPRIGFMKGGNKARWKDTEMAQFFVNKVKNYIHENANQPFFLYYGLHEPHVPRIPNPQFVGSTKMGARGDVLAEMDWCISELYKELQADRLLENTIIVFSSDNGPVLDDGYQDQAAELCGNHNPNGGYRGGKYSLFEAGTLVPFFVYWKDHISPNKNDALISQLDLYASFGKMIGAAVPKNLDSEEHLDVFFGKSNLGRKNTILEASGRLALSSGDFTLIPPYKGKAINETGNELGNLNHFAVFNLKQEPAQKTEIHDTALTNKLKKQFLKIVGNHYNSNTATEDLK